MNDNHLQHDLVSFENQLKSLVPSHTGMDREHLLYAAGAHEATRHLRVRQRLLSLVAGLSCLAVVGLIVALASRPATILVSDSGDPAQSVPSSQDADSQPRLPNSEQPSEPNTSLRGNTDFNVGFSRIINVDSWSREELLAKAGIQVDVWKHPLYGKYPVSEDAEPTWLRVTVDSSKFPDNEDVEIQLQFIPDDLERAGEPRFTDVCLVSRLESNLGADAPIESTFQYPESRSKYSHATILVWRSGEENSLDASGYRLSMNRMKQLIE